MVQQVQNNSTQFSLAFDGPEIESHGNAMPVTEVAASLLALNEACERANMILNGSNSRVYLEVRAVRPGSLDILLELQQIIEQGIQLFSGDAITSAANIKSLVFAGGGGLGSLSVVSLIKRLQGKPPKVIETNDDAVTIETEQGRVHIPTKALELFRDGGIRQALETLVRPLTRDGINSIEFKEGNRTLETITKSDADSFRRDHMGEPDLDTEVMFPRQVLKPEALNFNKDRKWRLHDGSSTNWYKIEDSDFAARVEAGDLRFGHGDRLICEVAMTQSFDVKGQPHMQYTIKRVIEHLRAPEQGRLT